MALHRQPAILILIVTCLTVLLAWVRPEAADDLESADQPLPPEVAAETMTVPEGFQVQLFAGEPDVQQPIGFCIDDRGRLWVAEAYNYPNHTSEPGDRILILEDTDHDGHFDKRTVFYDQLNYVTGIEVGFGGAWVMSPPNLYFIPDQDRDDVPDSPPEVLLDGFGTHANAHNLANGFAWGPDGWLYGTHGRTNWSMIGKPGTPDEQRIRFDGGVYRYHPIRHQWEAYCDGTTNPWGIDWDDYGQAFICNCVNPHLFHAIQGAHFEPWRNRQSSQFAYERIPTIADHLHFVGISNVRDGLGTTAEDAAGGGHAHCGTMVYLGDNWPQQYRNGIFMNNIHGRRINHDVLRRQGSGYTASHGPDLMKSPDPWFMGVTLAYSFDGSVYVSDWSDTGECHSVRNTQRQTGRIYRISYGQLRTESVDIARLSNQELVDLHLHRNDRYVRHARRVLQERMAAGTDLQAVHESLRQLYQSQHDVTRRLRALWTLHTLGFSTDEFLAQQLGDDSEHVSAWAVRLLCEDGQVADSVLDRFCELAETGDSALVRLHLASALQRLPASSAWPLAAALAGRGEDANDQNLPLMIWYGIEPLLQDDLQKFVGLIRQARIPLLRRHIARRIIDSDQVAAGLAKLIAELRHADAETQNDLLQGILTGLQGHRSYDMPQNWTDVYPRLQTSPEPAVRRQAQQLSLIFNDPQAIASLKQQARDSSQNARDRATAVDILVARKLPELDDLLLQLVSDPATRLAAIRGLSEYDHPDTPDTILAEYADFDTAARQQAILTLASRADWADSLLTAMESDQVARPEVSAYAARQLLNLNDSEITSRLRNVWGEVRLTSQDRKQTIERLRQQLTADALQDADLSAGREVFQRLCAACHRFFDTGQDIGPDITGAQRTNIDYLLENLVDPNAAVSRDFLMEVVVTTDGRVVTGLVESETQQALTLRTITERLVIPLSEIDERQTSSISMMPEEILTPLPLDDVRDLFGYLASPQQVTLPAP